MHSLSTTLDADTVRIANALRQAAQLLDAQGAGPSRPGAYRAAADTVDQLGADVRSTFDQGGIDALSALPRIGMGLARAIAEMLITGHWRQLERLQGVAEPASSFQAIPGIGPELAVRIHDTLHIDTLEELELAVRDGKLATVTGLGTRRTAAIRAGLEEALNRRRRWTVRPRHDAQPVIEPPIALMLEVDRLYRDQAMAGSLPAIAPKRLNAVGKAWLPVLHFTKDGWHFTALYANMSRAHEFGSTKDWVLVYFYNGNHEEYQRTIVTETRGSLVGKRVVRGRELACRAYYAT